MANMEYHLDLNKKIAYTKVIGKTTADKLIAYLKEVRFDANFDKSFNAIADFRKAEFDSGFEQASEVADFIQTTRHSRGHFKLAVIVGDLSEQATGLLATLIDVANLAVTIETFNDMQSAEEWILD